MTKEEFHELVKSKGLGNYWADRIFRSLDTKMIQLIKDTTVEEALKNPEFLEKCEDWNWYEDQFL